MSHLQRPRAFSGSHAHCQARTRIPAQPWQRGCKHGRKAQARPELEYEDVNEEELEKFLNEQDINERGFDPTANAEKLIGDEEIDEEQAKAYCRDVIRVLRLLKEKRDMPMREAKLILQIEDPSRDEARKLGVEDARGVSRDEMGAALEQVHAGKVPPDRIALRALHTEMVSWPFLDDAEVGAKGGAGTEAKPVESPDGMSDEGTGEEEDDMRAMKEQREERNVPGWRPGQSRPPVGRDPLEPRKGLLDRLPDWAGYGTLYAITSIPVIIAVVAIAILFFSSLR